MSCENWKVSKLVHVCCRSYKKSRRLSSKIFRPNLGWWFSASFLKGFFFFFLVKMFEMIE